MKRLIFATLSTIALLGVANYPVMSAQNEMPDDMRRAITIELRNLVHFSLLM